ncbi:PepSY-associated TM helix domain-containing protein [Pontibacter cellulosilyticus]|uniref:PepSY domain-containing protein n=1 Tax=Pontibacter cellulosilyticus TaxID=1720253 RepID=A0A923SJ89_9BACT|nr:PepSY-associated TM helix domain-containing protein [Pontibacter cellulosilyticus]MBC5992471.1 PepSY domain-containing protein [Pontibacter cellulosilyticus]
MRKLIIQLHLWIGLTTGAVLAVVGVTGSVYTFQPELTRMLYSDLYTSTASGVLPKPAEVVFKAAEKHFGAPVTNALFPLRELENYAFKVKGKKEWVFFDASTGAYLGEMEKRRGILDTVLEIHRQLTLGEIGSTITGICSLLLALVLVSSGLYLWLPRKKKKLKAGLTFKRNASSKRRNYDIHNVLGFYFSLPLFIAATTGLYFAFPEQVQAVADVLTNSKAKTPNPKELKSVYQAGVAPVSVYQLLEQMQSFEDQGYYKRNLTMPKDSLDYAYFSLTNASEVDRGPEYRPQVYLDQYSGQPLYVYEPLRASSGSQLTRNWFLPVHFGEIGGMFTRVLWFIMGLMPAILWVSGIVIWRNKSKKKKSQAKHTDQITA